MEAFDCSEMSFVSEVKSTYKCSRVFDGFAHLLSRYLVSQSASVACCTLCLCLCLCLSLSASHPQAKWPARTTAAEFWTFLRIYCHVLSWPVSFSRSLYALSLRATVVVPASQYSKTCCGTSQKTAVCILFVLRSSDHLQSSC
jgi:hypothetical protein